MVHALAGAGVDGAHASPPRCRSPGRSHASRSRDAGSRRRSSSCRSCCPPWSSPRRSWPCCPSTPWDRRGRSCSRTCSSTRPSWCASSASTGRRSTTAPGMPRRRSAPGRSRRLRSVTLPSPRAGARVGRSRGVPVLLHVLRGRAHPRRLALCDAGDRDLQPGRPRLRPAYRGGAGAPATGGADGTR